MSPIVYLGDPAVRDDLMALGRTIIPRERILRHYLHLGRDQRRRYFPDGVDIPLKKIFYALRPAMALRWMERHPTDSLPPMHFPTLLRESDPPASVVETTLDLMSRKALSRELGTGQVPGVIGRFIDDALERTTLPDSARNPPVERAARDAADAFFRRMLGVGS